MRIHVLSDLHLEFAPFQHNNVEADVVVFAGDVHTGANGIKWILQTFPDRPVIYVLGNHEFYGQKIQKLISNIKEIAHGTNVQVLENDRVEIGDLVFLGATLWTDFQLFGDPVVSTVVAQIGMNDFRRIRLMPTYRRFLPKDARAFHAQTMEWLARQIEEARGNKIVVVTHHAPTPKSIPSIFQDDPLSAAYASNLDRFIANCGVALWIHGHIHHHSDYVIGRTRVVSNPRGYPSEPHTGFDPSLVIEI
jgi:Icc-related predicted phosphoesterase